MYVIPRIIKFFVVAENRKLYRKYDDSLYYIYVAPHLLKYVDGRVVRYFGDFHAFVIILAPLSQSRTIAGVPRHFFLSSKFRSIRLKSEKKIDSFKSYEKKFEQLKVFLLREKCDKKLIDVV